MNNSLKKKKNYPGGLQEGFYIKYEETIICLFI